MMPHSRPDPLQDERLYRVLAEAAQDLVFIIDRQDRVSYVNSAASKLLDREPASLVGKKRAELFPASTNESQEQSLRRALQEGKPLRAERSMSINGKEVWLDTVLTPLCGEDGRPFAVLGVARDITELKRQQTSNQNAKDFLNKIINSVPIPVFVKDESLRYVLANEAAVRLTLDPSSGIVGRMDAEIFPKTVAEHIRERDLELLNTGQESTFEFEVPSKDSGTRVLLCHKVLYIDPSGGRFIVGISNDITGLRRMEEGLSREQTLRSLSVFAGGIAHDFNNLLTAILGNINLSRAKSKKTPLVFDALGDAETACQRAKDLARQLLTFSKGGAPVTGPVRIDILLQDTANFVLRGSPAQLEAAIPADLWPVEADESQLAQAVHNITLNARDALPQDGVIRLHARNVELPKDDPSGLPPGRYVRVRIADNGIGIPAEHLAHIFDPYFTTKKTGSGLGLAVAYSVITRHGGRIEAVSIPGAGTTFRFLLPAAKNALSRTSATPSEIPAPSGGGRILIVDDEAVVVRTACRILSLCGYEVESVDNGPQAVERYRQALEQDRCYDAVLMDLIMPGDFGGEEAARRILALDPRAGIVASTGYSDNPVLANPKRYGFIGTAPKPYTVMGLGTVMAKAVARTR
ncbi:MAG: PAS domain-containing protein [Elusimicrobiota bacterium]|jgi:PAS domain S-box-containing protein